MLGYSYQQLKSMLWKKIFMKNRVLCMFAGGLLLAVKLEGEVEVMKCSGDGEKGWDPGNPERGENSVKKKVSA